MLRLLLLLLFPFADFLDAFFFEALLLRLRLLDPFDLAFDLDLDELFFLLDADLELFARPAALVTACIALATAATFFLVSPPTKSFPLVPKTTP